MKKRETGVLRRFTALFFVLVLCVSLSFGCGVGGGKVEKSTALIVSDVHINADDETNTRHLVKTLEYVRDNDIDVVLFNGDLVSWDAPEIYEKTDRCFETVFGNVAVNDRPEFLFNMGNHEFYPNSNCNVNDTIYPIQYEDFVTFANKWMKEPIGEDENIYVRKVKGINYVVAFPGPSKWASIGQYQTVDFAMLDNILSEITEEGTPCIVATHWAWGYTYGGASYGMPNDYIVDDMTAVLAEYPSVINVTSHTHFSNLHERSLDQTEYTTVNVGPHCYAKFVSAVENYENGELIDYMNIERRAIVNDSQASQLFGSGATHLGIKMEFGEEEVTVKRFDIGKGKEYGHGSWTVPYGITKENMHDKFYYEAGEREGTPLNFAENAELSVTPTSGGSKITLNFADVEEYYAVEGYKIEIYDSGDELVKTARWHSLFWANLERKSEYTFTVDMTDVATDGAEFTVKVYPMDFFGHYNDPIVKTFAN